MSFQSEEAPRKMSQRQREEFNFERTRLKRTLLTCLGHALVKTQLPWHVSWNAKSMKSLLNCFCVNSLLRYKNQRLAPTSLWAVQTVFQTGDMCCRIFIIWTRERPVKNTGSQFCKERRQFLAFTAKCSFHSLTYMQTHRFVDLHFFKHIYNCGNTWNFDTIPAHI